MHTEDCSLKWRGEHLSLKNNWKLPFSKISENEMNLQAHVKPYLETFGMVVFSGVPIEGKTDVQATELLREYVFQIGSPVSQSEKFDFLGYVTNRGHDIRDHRRRGYESSAELPFHSDRCDLVSLLCVRQAQTGGQTRIASAYTAFCTLFQISPEFAELLCQPIPIDLRDTTSCVRWALMPVFSFENGTFVARYVRRFIEASQRYDDASRLTNRQREALDALDVILKEPGMSLELRLEPGDWLLLDNHRLLHARTKFQDALDPAQARLLLRTWLSWSGSPALPLSFKQTYGRIKAGEYRGGVWPKEKPLSSMPNDIYTAGEKIRGWL